MIRQAAATIFLSDNRKMQLSGSSRSFSTFSSEENRNTHHSNYSGLYVLNDGELAGSASLELPVSQTSYVILLPVTGDLLLTVTQKEQERINIGELKIISLAAGSVLQLSNPFENEIINYLQLMISAAELSQTDCLFDFELEENKLLQIGDPSLPFSLAIGRFSGRKEGNYKMKQKTGGRLFSFVIAGAFELADRLVQMRDGLALSDVENVEFEALSDGAILLFIELLLSHQP